MNARENIRKALICLGLALGTVLLYLPVLRFDFVNYDDPDYILHNFHINRGLNPAGFLWSFNVGYAGNWHPLTWMSHMLDCQLFGLSAGGPHAVNVLQHAFSAVLLFLVLHRTTKTLWRAALVAALFAWHPLRVESVAWISERKDVLSTAFWMLTMWAYIRYADAGGMRPPKRWLYYLLALVFFALGLMSKPMLVTLPFVLLLLDYWPLRRLQFSSPTPNPNPNLNPNPNPNPQPASLVPRTDSPEKTTEGSDSTKAPRDPLNTTRSLFNLVIEKLPFFALSFASCVITTIAQRGAMQSLTQVPISIRLIDALEAYYKYVEKTIWPAKLAAIYPLQFHGMGWNLIWSCLFITAVSVMAWRLRTSRPYWLVGWLWYLGTLVPVINLVQIGSQAMADRYTYIPGIGLALIVIWEVNDFSATWPFRSLVLAVLGSVVVGAALVASSLQIQYWRNGGTLFSHAVDVTPKNYIAMVNDAAYQRDIGEYEKARQRCEDALAIFPGYAGAHFMLGTVLFSEGKYEAAAKELQTSLQLDPTRHAAHYVLGGVALALNLGQQAEEQFTAALPFDPSNPDVRTGLGNALAMQGRLDEAVPQFEQALRFAPGYLDTRYQLAIVLTRQHKGQEAIAQYRILLGLKPDYRNVLSNLAWLLATDPHSELRDGNEALRLATSACSLTQEQQPLPLQAISAAYAEVGRFDDAIAAAQKAHDLAVAQNRPDIAAKCVDLLALYRAQQPYREQNRTE